MGKATVQRFARYAERASRGEWQDVTGRHVKHQVRWYGRRGLAEDSVLISDDSEFGKRRTGKSVDALVAWMYAIDQQALEVYEPGWPSASAKETQRPMV